MKKHLEHIVSLIFVIIACTLASCQEYDPFGEDVVRAARYERQFSDAIGTPAPRHAWGFDIASFFMSQNQPQTRTIYKQDENICTTDENGNTVNLTVAEFYGKPADITQREHDEVYNWFTNHRVYWKNDYANCGDGNYFTGSTKQFDGKAYTRSGEEGYKMLDMGSLVTNSPNKIGTCSVDSTLFFNGWIQYVNSDYTYDEIALNGSKYNCSSMNNLKVVDLKGSYQVHLNEFNGSGGYGWGKQSGMNAILATDSNFNEIEYHSSIDGLYHDKYIIVHLVGSDYSGWYLGMDLEGGGQNGNQRVKADGVCNDWIIKICDAGQSMFNPARILCEDLGSNDFDFNDVVIDIAAEVGANCALATVTVKAVGGTIPVCITYSHPDDIEANAFNKDGKFELHELFGAAVGQPINVHAPGGMETTREISWKVGFGRKYDEADYNYPDEQLNIHKFNVLVQHSNMAEWLTIRNYDEDNAVCAPQMICVPTTVDWPSENQPIVEKYTTFKEWVANPTKFFWTGNTTSGSSTNSGSNTGTIIEGGNGSNTGSGTGSEQTPVIEDPYTLWEGEFQPSSSDVLELDAATLKKLSAESTLKVYFTGDYLCARTGMWGGQLQGDAIVTNGVKYVTITMTQNLVSAIKSLKGLYFQGGKIYKITANAIAETVEEEQEETVSSQNTATLTAAGNFYRFSAMSNIPENAGSVKLNFTFDNSINGKIGVLDQYNNMVEGSAVTVGYSAASPIEVTLSGDLVLAAKSGNLYFVSYSSASDIKQIVYSFGN